MEGLPFTSPGHHAAHAAALHHALRPSTVPAASVTTDVGNTLGPTRRRGEGQRGVGTVVLTAFLATKAPALGGG